MRVCILGGTEAWRGDEPVDLLSPKQRSIVAALALWEGRPVSNDTLVDLVWGDRAPAGVPGTLHAYVATLRRSMEPERAPRSPAKILVTAGTGYALHLDGDLDARHFETALTQVRSGLAVASLLAPPRPPSVDAEAGRARLEGALALWRGSPYTDLGDHPSVLAERGRLEELRMVALEDRAVLGLALGETGTVAAELEALTAQFPLRERLWGLLALARARAGRQADALEGLRRVRTILADELGLEPSAELGELQAALLRQDPRLAWQPPDADATTPARQPRSDAPPPQGRPAPELPPWPMVGRDRHLSTLRDLLARAADGNPVVAAVTGEPGIGKSRLCAELGALAVADGAVLALGRCSQDDGAPPLWPWRQVLGQLGRRLETDTGADEGAGFRTWEAAVTQVLEAARERTLVLILDDVHWADPPTLRVVRLLLETAGRARLALLLTWRAHPEPEGELADVIETVARVHGQRLALEGLGPVEASEVVAALSPTAPSSDQAAELARRTDGNPFYLVEFARLARERGDLGALLAEERPPGAVQDVVTRRLQRLPDATRSLLRWAAVTGRQFELDVLAELAGIAEDRAIDALDPAVAAGLVREEGIGRYLFAHALVRDAAYAELGATRAARAHARAARALEERPGRETEVARHWSAAGPTHADRAWRAAASAAGVALEVHAHQEATELLRSAVAAQASDTTVGDADRLRLLMRLAEAERGAGAWVPLLDTVRRAVAVARRTGDVRLLGEAASAMTSGAMWQSARHGEVHEDLVAALREALRGLPADDPLTCRVMLALANELYYGTTLAERTALVDGALATARRLGDDALLIEACQIGQVSLWCPSTRERRLALAEEGIDVATRTADERGFVLLATHAAVASSELGLPAQMWGWIARTRPVAERLRLFFPLVVLTTLELPWRAMAGDIAEAERLMGELHAMARQTDLHTMQETLLGATMAIKQWTGGIDELLPMVDLLESGPLPVTAFVCLLMLRAGRADQARAHLAKHAITLREETWFSLLEWASAAETARAVGDAAVAARAYALLAPCAGGCVSAGSGNAIGPVDAFLALAASAVGEADVATRHAEEAARQMEEWRIPLAAQWWRDQRDRWGI